MLHDTTLNLILCTLCYQQDPPSITKFVAMPMFCLYLLSLIWEMQWPDRGKCVQFQYPGVLARIFFFLIYLFKVTPGYYILFLDKTLHIYSFHSIQECKWIPMSCLGNHKQPSHQITEYCLLPSLRCVFVLFCGGHFEFKYSRSGTGNSLETARRSKKMSM